MWRLSMVMRAPFNVHKFTSAAYYLYVRMVFASKI